MLARLVRHWRCGGPSPESPCCHSCKTVIQHPNLPWGECYSSVSLVWCVCCVCSSAMSLCRLSYFPCSIAGVPSFTTSLPTHAQYNAFTWPGVASTVRLSNTARCGHTVKKIHAQAGHPRPQQSHIRCYPINHLRLLECAVSAALSGCKATRKRLVNFITNNCGVYIKLASPLHTKNCFPSSNLPNSLLIFPTWASADVRAASKTLAASA